MEPLYSMSLIGFQFIFPHVLHLKVDHALPFLRPPPLSLSLFLICPWPYLSSHAIAEYIMMLIVHWLF